MSMWSHTKKKSTKFVVILLSLQTGKSFLSSREVFLTKISRRCKLMLPPQPEVNYRIVINLSTLYNAFFFHKE